MDQFSSRYGFRGAASEITIREDAPESLRAFVFHSLRRYAEASVARALVCSTLSKLPDRGNWSPDNVWDDVQYYIESCDWFRIYDLVESIYENIRRSQARLQASSSPFTPDEFAQELNNLFAEQGIGWKLKNGRVLARGSESFETVIRQAPYALQSAGMTTASDEIHKAIEDLSKRPSPDLTGAVQHGMAALECAGKYICEMTGSQTLNDVVREKKDLFRPPLNEAVLKLWGFANGRGRHLQEGGEPTYPEVELMVGIAASVATYLSRIARPQ